jgi:hypothetical protein
MKCAPRNPTGYSKRLVSEEDSPFERAARQVEKRSGVSRDVWMCGLGQHPLNERHYRLMCRLAKVDVNQQPRKRAA